MSGLLQLEGVHVSYGSREVIRDLSLSVHEHEFCALLGLNGSGKTTLLHAVCGFIPMSGTCAVSGVECGKMNERKRARLISFMAQVSSISGGRSVLDVVLMGFNARLGLLEHPSAEHRAFAYEALEQLGYAHIAGEDFGTLSQGQKQLVTLARCMVQDAPMLLLDEPDSALDFLNRHMVLKNVRDAISANARGGLVTLHDPNFAMKYCDRIFVLKDGRLAAEINMKTADADEIRQKLSLIYDEVDILRHKSKFIMWKL